MLRSYLSEFDLNTTMRELQKSTAKFLIQNSKIVEAEYRQSSELSKSIYDLAWEVLKKTLGETNICLPIDVYQVADKLGFIVSNDGFSDVELNYILSGHDCLPIAQLKMRRKLLENEDGSICGTIRISKDLNENSTRFSIAHELGHVVLRHQNPIGSSVIREACPGMYPLVDTEEMLADMFAQALLLPYKLFQQERKQYESDRTHWPLDFSMWIEHIRDKAQIPEYHAVIACQEIKKRNIIERMNRAEEFFQEWVFSIIDDDSETDDLYPAIKSLYARTVFNLEGWGFSSEQVADILFKNGMDSVRKVQRDIVSILHDYQLETVAEEKETRVRKQDSSLILPESIQKYVINALYRAGLSESGIMKITEIPDINFDQKTEVDSPIDSEPIQDPQNALSDSEDTTRGELPNILDN